MLVDNNKVIETIAAVERLHLTDLSRDLDLLKPVEDCNPQLLPYLIHKVGAQRTLWKIQGKQPTNTDWGALLRILELSLPELYTEEQCWCECTLDNAIQYASERVSNPTMKPTGIPLACECTPHQPGA